MNKNNQCQPNATSGKVNDAMDHLARSAEILREIGQNRKDRLYAYLKSQPQTAPCPMHADFIGSIDFAASVLASDNVATYVAVYEPCDECISEDIRLGDAGVPSGLLHATLENWTPRDGEECGHLNTVRRFLEERRGALAMFGNVGVGKSHLAVGVMRHFRTPLFIKQNTLLGNLLRTYRNPYADDPLGTCLKADLLVLDEVGLSGGVRDGFPILSEILRYRYFESLPTILTGDIWAPEFRKVIGEDLFDQLTKCAFGMVSFRRLS